MSNDSQLDHVDPRSPIALHYQLRQILRRQIESGEFKPGDSFPTSRELREKYCVSSTTVENTLRWLAERGLIHRQRGRGTVVSRPPVIEELPDLTGFLEAAEALGLGFEVRVLRAEFVQPSERQAELLALSSGDKVFRLDRLIMVGGEPNNLEYGLHPPDMGEWFLANPDIPTQSIYRAIDRRLAIRLDKACQTIGAVSANRREAELLAVRVGAPLVYFDRIVYLADSRPIQYVRCFLPASRYTISVWLKRRRGEMGGEMPFGGSHASVVDPDFWI